MEMVIVLLIVSILLTITMRFWSSRIVDLKAQSFKEQFTSYYNAIYSQNLSSSFRDGKKYQKLVLHLATGASYALDWWLSVVEQNLSSLTFRDYLLDGHSVDALQIGFTPYILWCSLASKWITGGLLSFQTYFPENGKQYCFEIKSETCKLIEQRCND